MNIAIIGCGRMGVAQARLARYAGDSILFAVDTNWEACERFISEFKSMGTADLSDTSLDCFWKKIDVIWIAVTDAQISLVSRGLKSLLAPRTVVFHTSGALTSEVIKDNLPDNPCASVHPLAACPLLDVSDAECFAAFRHIIHSIEGDSEAIQIAKQILTRIDAEIVEISPENKPLYHAAAVFASNYPVVLADAAAKLFMQAGLPHELAEDGARRLFALAANSVQNASFIDALTGPAKRRDIGTITAHRCVLSDNSDVLCLYDALLDAAKKMIGWI